NLGPPGLGMRGALGAGVRTLAQPRPQSSPPPYVASRAAEGWHPLARRVLAIVPPALAWAVLTSPVWAAIVAPGVLGGFLVFFAAYWLWRSLEFSLGLLFGLWQLRRARRRDWLAA